ncbi:hypothetical protein ACFX15_038115 [Malus domestica]
MQTLREARSRPERVQASEEQCGCRRRNRSHQRRSVSHRRQPAGVLDLQRRRAVPLQPAQGDFGEVYRRQLRQGLLPHDGSWAAHCWKRRRPDQVAGRGGARWIIHNVRHIPGLVRNLISVGKLDKEGYALQMSSGSWKLLKAGELLFTYEFELPPGFISMIRSD